VGSENLSHKRRARSSRDLARKKAKRARYDRVLIVCEGLKTEPNYLSELIDGLKLNSANVEVDGSCGSSPVSIVKYAKKRYSEEKKKGDAFDRVFCVFDKDSHAHYEQPLNEISNSKPKNVFQAINSVPCFEYWLLLHFKFTTKQWTSTGSKSPCESLIKDLKQYLPHYSKGESGLYQKLSDKTSPAIANRKRALRQAQEGATDNPTTKMHELLEYLQKLKSDGPSFPSS